MAIVFDIDFLNLLMGAKSEKLSQPEMGLSNHGINGALLWVPAIR
jgi:hypothetical protein